MSDLSSRLDEFARRLEALEKELAELRQQASPEAFVPPAPIVPPAPVVPPPTAKPPARAPEPPPLPPLRAEPQRPRREIDWSVFFGAKALAWAGGAVMLLGIVFFFVLAVNRGWIGPVARVSLGAIASALVFGAGLYVKRRYEELYHSALAAVGTGIGGAYMTLLAAKVLYDLVPDWAAMLIAAGIAAVGVATALAWSSELIAGLGLVGAALAPAAVGLETGDLSAAGTGFAAVVFAGTAVVSVRQRWSRLLAIGVAATLPQVAILLAQAEPTEWDVVAAAALFWLLYLGAATAWQDRLGTPALASLPASLLVLSGVLAGAASAAQFDGRDEGWAMLVAAGVYGSLAALLFPTRRHRDLSALSAAVALALIAVALADLLSGPSLAVAWAAEAAVLAWLARAIGDVKYQVASFAYLGAALVRAVFFDAPPTQLYEPGLHPAAGVAAIVAIAASAGIGAWFCRAWGESEPARGVFAPLEPLFKELRRSHSGLRRTLAATGGLAAVYAASLGLLGLAQWLSSGPVGSAFEWGHVAVTGLWGAVALALLASAHRVGRTDLRVAGLVWLGVVLLQTFIFVGSELDGSQRGYASLAGAGALLAGALIDRLSVRDDVGLACMAGATLTSVAFGAAGLFELFDGTRAESFALLGLATFYFAVAAIVFARDRHLSLFLWAPALGVLGYATWQLLDGTWLVLAWSAVSVALVALARHTGEKRLEPASFSFLVLALGRAVFYEAPLGDLFESNPHPESGVPSLLLVIAATAAFATLLPRTPKRPPPDPEANPYVEIAYALESQREFWRRAAEATAAVLCAYAASLGILGLAEAVGGASVETNFERGHSAVSAFWGLIGLGVLYLGLKRRTNWLRVVGLGLFGLALVKLFLYDLAFLSSVTRALSFLAVGALLLIAGFFVQRLSDERPA